MSNDPESGSIGGIMTNEDLVMISVDDTSWLNAHANVEAACREAALAVLDRDTLRPGNIGELTVVLSDDATVRRLNHTYRGTDQATNVLSFAPAPSPMAELDYPLGDVVLGFETVRRECDQFRRSLSDHVQHLVVHGCLHLLGFDHERDADAEEMEALETQILAGLGVPDPYGEPAAHGENTGDRIETAQGATP
jgi:probable rRNA maturation factor